MEPSVQGESSRLVHDVGYFEGEDKMVRVWTNGCFDILHRGHLELFRYARSLGDELIVGIDTDEKVKKDKGKNIVDQIVKRFNLLFIRSL